jgi:CubicO group peptidase (beta-lactamase class C family)
MQSYVDADKYAGASVLIEQGGNEVFYHQAGRRNLAADLPMERDTIVRLYSMTKPVTSVALMMLAERGLVHLDAPISDFLPGFSRMQALVPEALRIDQVRPCAVPNLQQLMTHTAGFSYPFNPGVLAAQMEQSEIIFGPGPRTLQDEVARLAQLPLAFDPGTRWEYSVSIDLLGRIVEVVSGQTLGDFFAAEIFGPLGMQQTGFQVPQGSGDRFASLYTPLAGGAFALNDSRGAGGPTLRLVDEVGSSPFETTLMHSGGGGLVGTIDDYMAFVRMLRDGAAPGGLRLLSPATLDFMRRNHLPGDIASMGVSSFAEQPMNGMGFGLGGAVVLDPARAGVPGSIGDFSWGGMASTFFWIDPVRDLSAVFLTQLSPSSSYPSRAQLKALVHGALTDGGAGPGGWA